MFSGVLVGSFIRYDMVARLSCSYPHGVIIHLAWVSLQLLGQWPYLAEKNLVAFLALATNFGQDDGREMLQPGSDKSVLRAGLLE